MKILTALLVLLLYLTPTTWASNEKKVGLAFTLIDSRDNSEAFFGTREINFYRVVDNQHILKVKDVEFRYNVIDSLPPGTYTMIYNNILEQERKCVITIPRVDSFGIQIAIDSLQSYNTSSIDKLHDGEKIEIEYMSNGCFHHQAYYLIIEQRKGRLRASLYDKNPRLRLSQSKAGKLLRRVSLDDSKKAAYTRFENELAALDTGNGGCTTQDFYQMSGPNVNLSKSDGGCSWNGYGFLAKSLFGRRYKQ